MKLESTPATNINGTTKGITVMKIVQNKGFIAGISLFVVFLFFLCIVRRVIKIRNSKAALKNKFTRVPDIPIDDWDGMKASMYGDLVFSLSYSYEKKALGVDVIQIFGLRSSSDVEVDSYVKVKISPELLRFRVRKTKVVYRNNNPSFSKKFNFKVPPSDLNKVVLTFEIYNSDSGGESDKMLGIVEFPYSSLSQDELKEFTIEKRVKISEPIDTGEGCGDICVVLRYIPLNYNLKVTILDARKLKLKKKKQYPPVFVSVSMINKNVSSKTFKTSVRYDTINPFFSETFNFELRPVQTQHAYLEIKLMQKVLYLFQKCIGVVKIGYESNTASGKNHWASTISNPKMAVAFWHSLYKHE